MKTVVRIDRLNDAVVRVYFSNGEIEDKWGEFATLVRRLDLRLTSNGLTAIRVI